MTDTVVSRNPLVKEFALGKADDELIGMLLQKQLPLTEEEYLESLVFTVKVEKFKQKSMEMLKSISESTKETYIAKPDANHRAAYFLVLEALSKQNSKIIAKAIQNQSFPYEFLIKIATAGNQHMLETLLENQVKLIAYPLVMDKIEANPAANGFIKGKIKEIKDFYLQDTPGEEIAAEDITDDVKEIISQEAVEEAKEKAKEEGKKEGEGEEEEPEIAEKEVEEKTLTTLQKINALSVAERVKLALTGTKAERSVLVKDSNKMVVHAVVESPKLSKDEISLIIRDKSIAGEIISKIASSREWTKDYGVIMGLIQNPKTPVKKAMGFIKMLHIRDLKNMLRDKNVNPVLRTMAINFYQQKTKTKK